MTTQHYSTITIIRKTLPLFIQYIAESVFIIAELYFISRLGAPAIAARGTASYVLFLLSGPFIGALIASYTTLLSQASSLYDRDSVKKIFSKLYIISFICSIIIALLLVSVSPYVTEFLCRNRTIDKLTLDYLLRGYIIGVPGITLFAQYLSLLYSQGRTREASICWILTDIVNIALDPIMIFYLGLGIAGAGIAFAISLYSALPLMYYFSKDRGATLKIDYKVTRNILESLRDVGAFTYMERIILSGLYSIYCATISRYGEITYTAYQLGLSLESFVYMPILSFRDIANILIGETIVKDREIARKTFRKIINASIVMTTPLALLLITLSPFIIPLYTKNVKIQRLAEYYITIAAISDIGHAVTLSGVGACQGAGRSAYAFFVDTSSMAATRIIPAVILSVLGINVIVIWFLMDLDAVTRGLLLYKIFIKYVSEKPKIFLEK